MRRALTILMTCALSASAIAGPSLEEDAKAFLARLAALGDAYDPALADLYADDAAIKAIRRYPGGQERVMELTGIEWKDLIRSAMPLARLQNDRSELREPEFEVEGDRVKVKANRYSFRKCYLDTGYYVILERQSDRSLRIVEEYYGTQAHSDCQAPPASADPGSQP